MATGSDVADILEVRRRTPSKLDVILKKGGGRRPSQSPAPPSSPSSSALAPPSSASPTPTAAPSTPSSSGSRGGSHKHGHKHQAAQAPGSAGHQQQQHAGSSPAAPGSPTLSHVVVHPGAAARELLALRSAAPQEVAAAEASMAAEAAAEAGPAFKEKRLTTLAEDDEDGASGGDDQDAPAIHWVMKEFEHPVRKDHCSFQHWCKTGEEEKISSRRKLHCEIYTYTSHEYEKYFSSANWTREETDRLFELCSQFDLRWIVIADRWEGPKLLEELKERFYSIESKLVDLRASPSDDVSVHPVKQFPYNRKAEETRRSQIDRLWNRTKEQIDEEESLLSLLKRMEHAPKKGKTPKHDTPSKRKRIGAEPAQPEAEASVQPKKRRVDHLHEASHTAASKKKGPGCFTRSSLMQEGFTFNKETAKKVTAMLVELDIPARPVPTKRVSEVYQELRQGIVQLLDLQKQVAKRECQLEALRSVAASSQKLT
ncbi:DNA methyltransferase 1-associated protein 1 [Pelomyxa schiedti]|nr:DNA methyltransferase 1-associated protein 1 [Pelomyxa schiedti]